MFSHVFGVELEILNLCCMAFLLGLPADRAQDAAAAWPRARCLCATSPSRVVWRSRAQACPLLSPFTLFLSLPIHSSALPRSLSLSPVRHGRAAKLLRRSLLHCLDIIEPPSTASASASGASTASPTLAAPPFAVRRAVVGTTAAAAACRRTRGQEGHGL